MVRRDRLRILGCGMALLGACLVASCRRSSPPAEATPAPAASAPAGAPSAPPSPFTVLSRGPGEPRSLVVGQDQVYFARTGAGYVQVVSRSGGAARELTLAGEVRGLALVGSHFYLLDEGLAPAARGERPERFHRLSRVALAGGAPELLARDLPLPGGLIVDGERLVWPVPAGRVFAHSQQVFLDHPGGLLAWPPAGDARAEHAVGGGSDGSAGRGGTGTSPGRDAREPALLVRELKDPVGLAADAVRFYTTLPGAARSAHRRDVVSLSREGGERRVLARGEHNPGQLRSDGKLVYWTSWRRPEDGSEALLATLRAVPVEGGEVRTLLGEEAGPVGLALDARFVYTTVPSGVVRLPLDPGAGPPRPQPVVTGLRQQQRAELAVDATHVYWSADGELRAARLPGVP